MTPDQINILIAECKESKWIESVEFTFTHNIRPELAQNFKGYQAIWRYADQQKQGWERKSKSLNVSIDAAKKQWLDFSVNLETFLINAKDLNIDLIRKRWNSVANHNGNFVPYELPEIDFLLKLDQIAPNSTQSAFLYFFGTDNTATQIAGKASLTGVLLAHEFATKHLNDLKDRKEADANFFNENNKNLQSYLSDVERQKNEFFAGFALAQTENIKLFKDESKAKTESLDSWHSKAQSDFTHFFTDAKTNIDAQKKAYSELLKLQEPAQYWADRAANLKKQARGLLRLLITFVVIMAVALYSLLWLSPESMLTSLFEGNGSKAIRWSIVFITFISVLFIAVRAISKMMFSSFHLARDAEERHQLTYLYLALKKDASVDDKDRQMILQSLFSRADTGLLKEDSAPTMPGIDKILNR